MVDTNWLRQPSDEPLFPDVLWSRPENRRHAGKLLIVGGNAHGFAAPAAAYAAAAKAGIGTCRVLLPDKLERTIGKLFPEAEFAPSNLSGSFGQKAFAQLEDGANWADGTLLAGDFGRNSETAIVLENFLSKSSARITLTGDSLDYYHEDPSLILDRENTTVVSGFSGLQKLLSGRLLIKHSMNLSQVVKALITFSKNCPAALVSEHSGQLLVSAGGRVSSTPYKDITWTELAVYAAVWSLQQPKKPFEALTTAAHEFALVSQSHI